MDDDEETGEATRRDTETGESPSEPLLNEETGEREMNYKSPTATATYRSTKNFKIPKNCLPNHNNNHNNSQKTTKKNRLKYNNDSGTMSSVVLFLLPTIYFAPIVATVLLALEIIIHIWAHKKNKKLKDSNVFYQSPLHVFISEFCACCKDESTKNKITMIQDKNNYKLTKYGTECFRIVT